MSRTIFSILAILLLLTVLAFDDARPSKAKVNLNTNQYMGVIPVSKETGEPDPKGIIDAPIFLIVSQEMDRLCGMIVSIGVDYPDTGLPIISLTQSPMENGKIIGKKITIDIEDYGASPASQSMAGAVQGNGDIKGTFTYEGGVKIPGLVKRVNQDGYYSGIYIGKIWEKGEAKPKNYNLMVSMNVIGNKVKGTTIFFLNDQPDGIALGSIEGTLDKQTGAFEYHGTGDLDNVHAIGTVKNGVFNIETDAWRTTFIAEASNFGDMKLLTPQIKGKAKPRVLKAGESTEVLIPLTNCVPGFHVGVTPKVKAAVGKKKNTPDVYIEKYRIDGNNLRLTLNVADNIKGTCTISVTNPCGTTMQSKKLKIK